MKKEPFIFVLTGKARGGKDTAADFIVAYLETKNIKSVKLAYAKYIKMYCKDYLGWDGREETKPRDLLQYLGTDIIRDKLNKPFFFVDRMCDDIEILSNYFDYFIISDAREEKEILVIKEKFKNVVSIKINSEIENDLTPEQRNHYIEKALDNFSSYDQIIENNGSLEELNHKIIDLTNKYIGDV